jgi:ketosteroid isomerase-like protein
MTPSSPRIRELLDGPSAAHLAVAPSSLSSEAPTLDPVWVGRDGERIVVATDHPPIGSGAGDGAVDAAPDGAAVTLSVADPAAPAERVVIHGRAEVAAADVAAGHVDALAVKYLGQHRAASAAPLTVLLVDVASAEVQRAELAPMAVRPDLAANTAVVVDMLAALARGDRARARAAFADDATWQCPPSMPWPPFYEGRDAIFDQYFAVDVDLFETGVSEYDLEVLNTVAEGDHVSVEMRHRGAGLDGQAYETDHSVIYVVRDGLIVAVREYIDTLYLTRALLG